MQIRTIQKDSKHSNPNSNHSYPNSNHSTGIRMQILNIRTKFEAFECKF